MNMFNTGALLLLAACGVADTGADTGAGAIEDTGFLAMEMPRPQGFVVIDQDGDGYRLLEDCDDRDRDSYPGAPELCDGADNDCDGAVDEGLIWSTAWADADGDGLGDPAQELESCTPTPPPGYVPNALDCDDADAAQPALYYIDADADGCGDIVPGQPTELSCDGAPQGYSPTHDDCDDGDPSVCGC